MKTYKRVFCIVIDSVGCGECPDSYLYGDKGANTLKHLSYSKPDFSIPTLKTAPATNGCSGAKARTFCRGFLAIR